MATFPTQSFRKPIGIIDKQIRSSKTIIGFPLQMATQRVIAIIDIDSFECQIYKRLYPGTIFFGEPWVVVDKTGRIVSATHEAREVGISRQIRLREAEVLAKQHNINLRVFEKPNDREKPDAKEVRYATWEILDCLKDYATNYCYLTVLELASCDEFYLDLTNEVNLRMNDDNVFPVIESRTFLEAQDERFCGDALRDIITTRYKHPVSETLEHEKKLLCGALIMQEVNNFLFSATKLIGSVGIGSNKLTAKLAVNLNKPNGITILPDTTLSRLGKDIKIEKIPGFGGNFGNTVKEIFSISTMNELASIELEKLEEVFDQEKCIEIYFKCRGISDEPVKKKYMNDKVSCSKTFYGEITSDETLQYHIYKLIEEMIEKMEEERERHLRQPTVFRFTITYYPNKGMVRDEEKLKNWFHSIPYEHLLTCTEYCANTMNAVFASKSINTLVINITKIKVTAKDFIFHEVQESE